MYRRIEFIHEADRALDLPALKCGIVGVSHPEVVEAWFDHLRGPARSIPRNSRFYFTEAGWEKVGRHVSAACRKTGQRYRVIAVKHREVAVCWEDRHTGLEVAAQPIARKHQGRHRRSDRERV